MFTNACIGHIREVPCWFDFSLRELVPLPDSIHPAEFWKNRSSTVSVIATKVERRSWDIGRYALSREKIFRRADWTILWRYPPEFTTMEVSGLYDLHSGTR